jgi:hypothetical protein
MYEPLAGVMLHWVTAPLSATAQPTPGWLLCQLCDARTPVGDSTYMRPGSMLAFASCNPLAHLMSQVLGQPPQKKHV